jgi:hypothetical protein
MVESINLHPLKLNIINAESKDKSPTKNLPINSYSFNPSIETSTTTVSSVKSQISTLHQNQIHPPLISQSKITPPPTSSIAPKSKSLSRSALYFTSSNDLLALSSSEPITRPLSISSQDSSETLQSYKVIQNRGYQRKHNEKLKPFKQLSKSKTPIELIYNALLIAHPEYDRVSRHKLYQELDNLFIKIDILVQDAS